MITAVDTNVLLDLLIPGAPDAQSSADRLTAAAQGGSVILSPIVVGELGAFFETERELTTFLRQTGLRQVAPQIGTLHLAGQIWKSYANRRGGLTCPGCGTKVEACAKCASPLRVRQHILSDFLIGAHAQLQADQLLTRDRGYYKSYFPQLRLAPG